MSDYIKREDAIKASTPAFRNAFSDWEVGWIESKDDTKDMIENLPSEDVAPVRHGRWEKNDDLFLDTLYRCSVCGEEFYIENGTPQENQYYYCPNCGAKMDGEKKNCDTCKHYDKR